MRSRSGKPPISAHPAFPAVVALWFAALLGIGSLILPVRLYETVLTATGISSIISAAAPPLGFTARALIALVATVAGAGLGYFAARKIISRGQDSSNADRSDAGHRTLNPLEDLDGEVDDDDLPPIRQTPATTGRRRALAMEEEDGVSEMLNVAPLPGGRDGAGLASAECESFFPDDADALELMDEVSFDGDAPEAGSAYDETHQDSNLVAEDIPPEAETREADEASALPDPLPFSPPSLAKTATPEAAPKQASYDFLNPASPRLFDSLANVSAKPEISLSDQPETSGIANASEDPVFDKPFTPSDAKAPRPFEQPSGDASNMAALENTPAPESPAHDDEISGGLVQLVQKLGSTLEKHREWSAQRAAQVAAPATASFARPAASAPVFAEETAAEPPIPQEFDPAAPDDAAEAMAAYFKAPAASAPVAPAEEEPTDPMHPSNPAPVQGEVYAPMTGLGHVAEEEEDDSIEEIAASFKLPLTPAPARVQDSQQEDTAFAGSTRPAFDVPPASRPAQSQPEDAPSARDADYASLAANNPFKSNAEDFVRIDEPEPEAAEPAVVFPNQGKVAAGAGAASNDDNERALREALMNLQRMGK